MRRRNRSPYCRNTSRMRGMSVASNPSPRIFMVHPKPSGGFEWAQARWGAVLRCLPLLEVADHFFTAGDLQLRGDEDEWNGLAALAGVSREHLLLIRQVHGAAVAVAQKARPELWRRPDADVVA